MQANSTINQSGASGPPQAYIENDATTWTPTSSELTDAQVVVADGEAAAWNFEPNLLATLDLRLPRWITPYSLQSERRKARYELYKQGLDVVGSLILLLLTSPIFLIVTICIKLTSPGPVLYKHRRLGRGGKEFWCFKFRTMAADAEEQLKRNAQLRKRFEGNFKIKDDPRVTRLGAFLRKTSLDELPQLVTILQGEMSLIGPRAIVKTELERYSIYGNKLLSVKPGLSGLWQVSGRSNVEYPERVFLDMHYIDHRCLLLDLQLMFRTPVAVLRGDGAC
jgi:lipopolysaccharide/colanic/teichoic acid biosynthesis glycosyltransferase